MEYYVYVLKNDRSNGLYIGMSIDPLERLLQHNRGENKSTKAYKPYRIIYTEKLKNRTAARSREKFLKSGCGREFIKKMGP